MRLVLIDKQTNRVCGDTSAFASSRFDEWEAAAARGKDDLEALATIAARLLDESLGKTCRAYEFSTFEAKGETDGYFVYDCDYEAYQGTPGMSGLADPAAMVEVVTRCFYVGYVRCDH